MRKLELHQENRRLVAGFLHIKSRTVDSVHVVGNSCRWEKLASC